MDVLRLLIGLEMTLLGEVYAILTCPIVLTISFRKDPSLNRRHTSSPTHLNLVIGSERSAQRIAGRDSRSRTQPTARFKIDIFKHLLGFAQVLDGVPYLMAFLTLCL